MENNFRKASYIKAKKRVKEIKDFYVHFLSYILVNIFISSVIIVGLIESGYTFQQTFSNFGVYSVWIFWGIGMFFHWLGVFGFQKIGFSKDWEERKIKELMEKDDLVKRNLKR